MKPELKSELRYRIPGVIVLGILCALVVVLMKPMGFGFLETFTVVLCVDLIFHDPVMDAARVITAPKTDKNDD